MILLVINQCHFKQNDPSGKNAEDEEEDEADDSDVESDDESDLESDAGSDVSDDDELEKRGEPEFIIAAVQTNGTAEVFINGFGWDNQTMQLSKQCLYTLNYPVEK